MYMRKMRRFTAITVLFAFMTSLYMAFPPPTQAAPAITSVYIDQVYNSALSLNVNNLEVIGTGLKDVTVRVMVTGQGSIILGRNIGSQSANDDDFLKFTITSTDLDNYSINWNEGIWVGTQEIPVNYTNMPTITAVEPTMAYAGTAAAEGTITLKGSNMNNGTMTFGNSTVSGTVVKDLSEIKIHTLGGDTGWHDVIFTDTQTDAGTGASVRIRKTYLSQFRLTNPFNISNLQVFPLEGVAGKTVVTFTADSFGGPASVFFQSTGSPKSYYKVNMGIIGDSPLGYTPGTPETIRVIVPDLPVGQYNLVLTNEVVPTGTEDLSGRITKEYEVRDKVSNDKIVFTIVGAKDGPEITAVRPNTGPNDSTTPVTITGRNFEENLVDGLSLVDSSIQSLSLSSDNRTLILTYEGPGTYSPTGVSGTVTREFKVYIGAQATFQSIAEQYFVENNYDTINILTGTILSSEIGDKDIYMQLTTKIDGITIHEEMIPGGIFTYTLSYVEPVIDTITPDKIQVLNNGLHPDYKIKEEMYLGVSGQNFMVNRYIINQNTQEQTVIYPIIDLGGSIKIKRVDDVVSISVSKDSSGADLYVPYADAVLEVYNDGTVMDGSTGKDFGKSILIKLPADLAITVNNINSPTYVSIYNPRKGNVTYYEPPTIKSDIFQFVTVSAENTPVITDVDPEVVATTGSTGVKITGYNFLPGVKLYLEDKEISCTRNNEGTLITFDAPAWREGKTRLLVMNPNGGMAGADFFYVQSYSIIKITSVTPPEGTTNSLVTIDGEGFMLPNPTADLTTDLGIYRLIGSRVLLGNKEINTYNMVNNKITLQPYSSSADNLLLQIDSATNQGYLSDYYHSVVLEDSNDAGKFYVIRYNDQGEIIMTNGPATYRFNVNNGIWQAVDGNNQTYDVNLTTSGLEITALSLQLQMMTPYKIENGVITGNRVKIIDRGTRILITIPNLELTEFGVGPGTYDVTVVNPDINRATLKNGFTFKVPSGGIPIINAIIPNEGHVSGGYSVKIEGANFYPSSPSSRVFINSIEATVTLVTTDAIYVTVPAFPGNLQQDWGVSRKSVPVAILNPDGGSAGKENAFTYVVAGSQPTILSIVPNTGTAAGGNRVIINGYDFRYYEPYDRTSGQKPSGDSNVKYTDINNNQKWDDLSGYTQPADFPTDPADPDYVEDPLSILPQIYFGEKVAKILYYDGTKIIVEAPAGTGRVDVYVVNNDYGVSNKVSYTYTSMNPAITSVVPNVGNKLGNEPVEILGKDFGQSIINLWARDDTDQIQLVSDYKMALVRFGDISNRGIRDGEVNYGSIVSGPAVVALTGSLTVSFNGSDKLTFELDYNGKNYTGEIPYDNVLQQYVDLNILETSDGDAFPGHELVKVYVEFAEQRLVIERGYAITTTFYNDGHLLVTTPPYYTVGQVSLQVINSDGSAASSTFTYKNPLTSPTITNITRDQNDPVVKDVNGEEYRALAINYKGGAEIKVFGTEFIRGAVVQIVAPSGVITISNITYDDESPASEGKWLKFTMPAVAESEVGNYLPLVITNEDGGVAWSNKSPDGAPIYFEITKGETEPAISGITPEKGPAEGGTWLKIQGKDFRELIEGFGDDLRVIFDDTPATDFGNISYEQVIVKTPAHAPGQVNVRLENPDGTFSIPMGTYTYISKPVVTRVVKDLTDYEDMNYVSIAGGQEVYIKGSDFQPGARVVFSPVLASTGDDDTGAVYRVKSVEVDYIQGTTSRVLDPYKLTDGEQISATFIDSETLKITTPSGKLKTGGLVVINGDNGLSDLFSNLNYDLPRPDSPLNVVAELVYSRDYGMYRGIRIFWSAVEGAREYEVYMSRGGSEHFIGTTEIPSFLFTDLDANTSYRFIIKAVGDFAASAPSGESNTVRTGDQVGYPDLDGKLGERTTIDVNGKLAVVKVGYNALGADLLLDMTKGELQGVKELELYVPSLLMYYYDPMDMKVIFPDGRFYFNTTALKNNYLREDHWREDAGVRIMIKPAAEQINTTGVLPLSTVYDFEAYACVGQNSQKLDYLDGEVKILLDYNDALANMRRYNKISFNKYDFVNNNWTVLEEVSGSTFKNVMRTGRYAILGRR